MKFYLVKNQKIEFGRVAKSEPSILDHLQASVVVTTLLETKDESNFISHEDCLKLRDVLERAVLSKRDTGASEESTAVQDNENHSKMNGILQIELGLKKCEKGHLKGAYYWRRPLHGICLSVIGDSSEDWIEILMDIAEVYLCEASMQVTLKLENLSFLTNEMKMKKIKSEEVHHLPTNGGLFDADFVVDDGFHCELDIVVAFNRMKSVFSCFSLFAKDKITPKEILLGEVGCDLSILTSDGVQVKCHKIFLLARSDVFKSMFKGSFKESKTNVLEISDMNEKSVRAFLEYLYYNETKEAHASCAVAYDLLRAGHKYAIADLEDRMKYILLSKADDWFQAEVAVKLFRFARNIDGGEPLKMKAVKEIVRHQGELTVSNEFSQFFKEDAKGAMELFQCAISEQKE